MASFPPNGRPRRAASALAVTLCAGLLAGCGGSSGGSPAAGGTTAPPGQVAAVEIPADLPQTPACGLLTVAEVEAAVGAKVTPGRQDAQTGRSLCVFNLAAGADQTVLVVSTSSSGVPAAFEAARARIGSPSAQSITAGDAAFVVGGQALVRKGTTMVAIVVAVRQAAAQLTAMATRLAQAAGARL